MPTILPKLGNMDYYDYYYYMLRATDLEIPPKLGNMDYYNTTPTARCLVHGADTRHFNRGVRTL